MDLTTRNKREVNTVCTAEGSLPKKPVPPVGKESLMRGRKEESYHFARWWGFQGQKKNAHKREWGLCLLNENENKGLEQKNRLPEKKR